MNYHSSITVITYTMTRLNDNWLPKQNTTGQVDKEAICILRVQQIYYMHSVSYRRLSFTNYKRAIFEEYINIILHRESAKLSLPKQIY